MKSSLVLSGEKSAGLLLTVPVCAVIFFVVPRIRSWRSISLSDVVFDFTSAMKRSSR